MSRDVSLFRVGQFWHYRFRLDGVRVQRSTGETVRALAYPIAASAFEAAKARARGEEPEPTLRGLLEQWAQARRLEVSPARVTSMETFGRLHFGSLLDLKLREITPKLAQTARNAYLEDHAKSSGNTWTNCLHGLFGWARNMRMIREIPWRLPKLKVQRKPKITLPVGRSDEWLEKVDQLSAHDPGLGLVVRICFTLGLRVSEAIEARWDWLDWERNTYTPGDTKGLEAWARPVPAELLDLLRKRSARSGFMVPSRPAHPITDARVRYLMLRANRACGTFGVTPHRLRGTYATLLSEAGVPIQDIQRALGHKDVRTTMGYLETSLERIAQGQNSIAARRKAAGRGTGEPTPRRTHDGAVSEFTGEIPNNREMRPVDPSNTTPGGSL
jgi:integrase